MKKLTATLVVLTTSLLIVGNVFAAQLDEQTQQALLDALNDEYKAHATYQKVIEQFGQIRPFTNIIKAEETHIQELLPLFEKYGVEVPEDNWYETVPSFNSEQEALEAGVQAEIENAEMYDEFFKFVKEEDIITVFTQLRDASQEKHLPAFERAAGRSTNPGGGQGSQNVRQPGRGRNQTQQAPQTAQRQGQRLNQSAQEPQGRGQGGRNQTQQAPQTGQRQGQKLNQSAQEPQGGQQSERKATSAGRGRR